MNIYISFLQSKIQHPIPAYSFWEYYIKNGIKEAGYQWLEGEVDWARGLIYSLDKSNLNKWKTVTWEKTIKDIKQKHAQSPIKFFLSYLYPHQIEEQAIKEIQKMGIPCVNFFCDNVRDFTKIPKEFGVFDLNWVPEYKALEMYKNAKYNYIYLPMPMWVAPKYRNVSKIETNHISFIGSKDIQRLMMFEKLCKEESINLRIYGAGWHSKSILAASTKTNNFSAFQTLQNQFNFIFRFGFPAYLRKLMQLGIPTENSNALQKLIREKPDFDKYILITQESAITLGVNRYPSYNFPLSQPNTYSRLRDIEAPMLGACYLTEYTEGVENLYELGNEIEVYRDTNELVEKIKYLISNPSKRIDLKKKGQIKALSHHSISNSIESILKKLK